MNTMSTPISDRRIQEWFGHDPETTEFWDFDPGYIVTDDNIGDQAIRLQADHEGFVVTTFDIDGDPAAPMKVFEDPGSIRSREHIEEFRGAAATYLEWTAELGETAYGTTDLDAIDFEIGETAVSGLGQAEQELVSARASQLVYDHRGDVNNSRDWSTATQMARAQWRDIAPETQGMDEAYENWKHRSGKGAETLIGAAEEGRFAEFQADYIARGYMWSFADAEPEVSREQEYQASLAQQQALAQIQPGGAGLGGPGL